MISCVFGAKSLLSSISSLNSLTNVLMTSSAFGTVNVNSIAWMPPAKHALEISIACSAFSARTTAITPVSINDLIEEIIGEFENIQSEIKKIDDTTYKINCSVEISKVERVFKVNLKSNAVTLNGWIIEQFSAVPEIGYEFDYDKFRFKVTESNEKQVISVTVTTIPEN